MVHEILLSPFSTMPIPSIASAPEQDRDHARSRVLRRHSQSDFQSKFPTFADEYAIQSEVAGSGYSIVLSSYCVGRSIATN